MLLKFLNTTAANYFFMKYLIIYITLFNAIIYPVEVVAQSPDTTIKWDIQKCFRYATEHNIQVNTLRLAEQSYKQDLLAAKGLKQPGLSGTITNNFDNANNNTSGTGALVNQLTSIGSYSVNSSIILWNGNYINNSIRQQQLQTQSAAFAVQQSQYNITLAITQAYLNILLAKENEKYLLSLVATTDSSVQKGQMLYDAGSIAKVGLLQLQAQLATDKYLLVQTQNAIGQNVLLLKQLLQLPAGTIFEIVIPAAIDTMALLPSLISVQEAAQNTFPEIKMGKLGVDIAAISIAKARANFKPILKASAALGSGYSNVFTNNVGPKTAYITQTGNNFYQQASLSLLIPIFSQRVNETNLAKSKIAYQQAALNYQNDKLVLSQAVELAYLNATNAQDAFIAASQQLIPAVESFRIGNEQFKLGAINAYDLLLLQNQYVQAKQAYTQAKYTAVLEQKIFEFYMGQQIKF
jgi:outer membrane protein